LHEGRVEPPSTSARIRLLKITMNIDITPEEMRRLVGLPDVQAFNEQLMDKIREKMEAGVEGYDPMSLFQPYMKGTMAGLDLFQRMMASAMTGGRGDDARDSGSD
jgi:hypothetical protein